MFLLNEYFFDNNSINHKKYKVIKKQDESLLRIKAKISPLLVQALHRIEPGKLLRLADVA